MTAAFRKHNATTRLIKKLASAKALILWVHEQGVARPPGYITAVLIGEGVHEQALHGVRGHAASPTISP